MGVYLQIICSGCGAYFDSEDFTKDEDEKIQAVGCPFCGKENIIENKSHSKIKGRIIWKNRKDWEKGIK